MNELYYNVIIEESERAYNRYIDYRTSDGTSDELKMRYAMMFAIAYELRKRCSNGGNVLNEFCELLCETSDKLCAMKELRSAYDVHARYLEFQLDELKRIAKLIELID